MGLVMACCVMGLAIAYRIFNFPDLTIEGSFLLGAVGVAVALKSGLPLLPSVVCAALLGACAGAITALLHARFGMNKFLAGIIVVSICYTAGLRLMGVSNIGLLDSAAEFDRVDAVASVFGVQVGKIIFLFVLLAVIACGIYAFLRSRSGLRLRVAGCNSSYAAALGVGVTASTVLALAVTNALAAISGAVLALHQGFADIGLGQGVLIFALASMSLGERLFSERGASVVAYILVTSICGSIVYQLIVSFAVRIGLNPIDLKLVTAILVLGLVVSRVRKGEDASSLQ